MYKYIETKDKLYAKAYKVFSGSATSTSVNIKSKYPDVDYTKLTNADFVCSYRSDNNIGHDAKQTAGNRNDYYIQANSMYVAHSYNASTGVLSISVSNSKANGGYIPDGYGNRDYVEDNWSGLFIEAIMIVDGVRTEYT